MEPDFYKQGKNRGDRSQTHSCRQRTDQELIPRSGADDLSCLPVDQESIGRAVIVDGDKPGGQQDVPGPLKRELRRTGNVLGRPVRRHLAHL